MSGWNLGEPDIQIADGRVTRVYHAACYLHETKVRGAAELAVLFWLAPRGRWGTVEVRFLPPERPRTEPEWLR